VQTVREQKETKGTKNHSDGQAGPGIIGILEATAGGIGIRPLTVATYTL
jgi:hypothetical protein